MLSLQDKDYIHVLQLEIQLSRVDLDPINRSNPAIFVFLSQPWPGFPMSDFLVFFVFSEFRWEVIVRFVDIVIGGNVDQHCLNFLFINYHLTELYNNLWIINRSMLHYYHKNDLFVRWKEPISIYITCTQNIFSIVSIVTNPIRRSRVTWPLS